MPLQKSISYGSFIKDGYAKFSGFSDRETLTFPLYKHFDGCKNHKVSFLLLDTHEISGYFEEIGKTLFRILHLND